LSWVYSISAFLISERRRLTVWTGRLIMLAFENPAAIDEWSVAHVKGTDKSEENGHLGYQTEDVKIHEETTALWLKKKTWFCPLWQMKKVLFRTAHIFKKETKLYCNGVPNLRLYNI
jgi:hypothetical protein